MRRLLFSLFCLFFAQQLSIAQIVWTEPVFPTPSQPVTIYFDATEGTAGLANCNCDVYIHTGLITSKSNSPSDWQYTFTKWGEENEAWKMTPVSGRPNVYSYEITPSIQEMYDVNDPEEEIRQIAMVFRDGAGNREGKETGGKDIFYDVYADDAGFVASLTRPTEATVFAQIGAVIPIEGIASAEATLSLYDNGELLAMETGASLNYTLFVNSGGFHLVEFIADNGTVRDTSSFTYVIPDPTVVEALPDGIEPGINYLSDTDVVLAMVAPGKNHVFLIGDFNDWEFSADYQLKKTPDGSTWWIEINGLTPGRYYGFQYVVDGRIRTGDPYSQLVLDSANDRFISEDIFPNMPPYPNGKTGGIVSLMQPGAPEFQWQVNDFERPDQTNLVIYELLMRDFLVQDYASLTGMLDYFTDLGVNAIELMPVNEFDGNISWGYNPTYHHALDKAYGTPEAFKALVDECHARGIAVIVDVVFNHAHENNPFCMLYWDEANFRPAANNPWLNPQPTHDFNVFFDFNHESPGTRYYVKRTLQYYLTEYRVDGFRFDLSKGFTQNQNGPFDAGPYDATRIATIKEYADAMREVSEDAYVILEHFAANDEERELSDYGCMLWSGAGLHNQYMEAAMGYNSNLSDVSYRNRNFNDPHLITYIESHDEERLVYKCLGFGNASGNYSTQELATALERSELASAFFYTVPGPKMLWQFAELGYEYPINYCEDGSLNDDCRTGPKPIPTNYIDQPDRFRLYNTVRALNELRNNYEVFQTTDFQLNTGGFQKTIHLNHGAMNVAVLGNFAVTEAQVSPNFQHTGWWYEYFTGDSLEVTNTSAALSFAPGEYRLYTDVRIEQPEYLVSNTKAISAYVQNWSIAPNPSNGAFNIQLQLEESARVELSVFDLQGRRITTLTTRQLPPGRNDLVINEDLQPGVYLLRLMINGAVDSRKIVVF